MARADALQVYVNPDEPNESVIENGLPYGLGIVCVFLAYLVALIGLTATRPSLAHGTI